MKKILFFSVLALLLGCQIQQDDKKFLIYDESIKSIIDVNSKIEIIADSISLPEGPLWDEKSN